MDSLLPPEIARKAEEVGAAKCRLPFFKLLVLAVLAGAFISLGAVFSTTVGVQDRGLPVGVLRLIAGAAFSLGLVLVVLAGAELFTGNNLIVMAWARGRVSTRSVLRNWLIVYVGNAIGAISTAFLVVLSGQHELLLGHVGTNALAIANAKLQHSFVQAVALGTLCNALVCLAIWIAMAARTVPGRVIAVMFPITAFVTMGFEHSIANLYFVPYALLLNAFDPGFVAATSVETGELTVSTFLVTNLIPVTIGNIIGGAVLVAAVYWFVYLWRTEDEPPAA